ncbi:WXG100 family type VII secretion target [Crossiella sp. CA-258035]|uniref:WXG100 family type VII secretion target n=1 Tax=Crossiella sp. CA-258035 TaxID=2981138 RepID=UPI0024BD1A37|nr:WXG100 family type VII secretion target [Crossiella sp. CA-258035]WHT18880.1 WXG100 family type VII secretion target [Crossiella sp. CA-258035]
MEIAVDFAQIGEGQAGCQRAATNMQSKLDDLKANLAPLVATWEGAAAEAYQARQKEWDQSAEKLQAILNRMGIALGTARDAYQQNEQSAAGSW